MKSIIDKASVSVDFPDKAYMGAFGRESQFGVQVDGEELLLKLARGGDERREVAVHLHHYLLAGILEDAARAFAATHPLDEAHRASLHAAAVALEKALRLPRGRRKA